MPRLIALIVVGVALVGAAEAAAPGYPLVLEELPSGVALSHSDPLSLARVGRRITLGEYHYTWAVSPNRARVAFGISAPGRRRRVGIRVVDLRRWKIVANIETGIAAETLWWPKARRLVAVLQGGDLVVADPATSKLVKRVPLAGAPEVVLVHQAAVTARGLVVLLHDRNGTAPPVIVALIAADGSVRTITLDRIPVPATQFGRAALAVDGDRALVLGDGLAADVDLGTLSVTYHDGSAPAAALELLHAVPLRDGVIAVAGRRSDDSPAGLDLLDTTTWHLVHLEDAASQATGASGVVLAYRRDAPGVRGYDAAGRHLFTILGDEPVHGVVASGATVYVQTTSSTVVVDAVSGRIVRRIVPAHSLLDIIDLQRRPS